MSDINKWRRDAARKLALPVQRNRDISSTIGKVDDQFEGIFGARRRGMPWKQIAAALDDGEEINADALESAFKRLCAERGIEPPKRVKSTRLAPLPAILPTVSRQTTPRSIDQANLFANDKPERWIDDGE